jgi:putative transcriptional regulator
MAHPDAVMLRGYAAGTSSEGISLLVATHLTYCQHCRQQVREYEAIAASLFANADEPAVASTLLADILGRLDTVSPGDASASERERSDIPGVPRPLAAMLDKPFDALRWRFRVPGVSEVELDGDGEERISLIRVRPGYSVPSHTHTAVEATLVLQGTLSDGHGQFGVGDVSVATSEHDHHPSAAGSEDCICLTVLGGSLRFTGPLGPALNLFAE